MSDATDRNVRAPAPERRQAGNGVAGARSDPDEWPDRQPGAEKWLDDRPDPDEWPDRQPGAEQWLNKGSDPTDGSGRRVGGASGGADGSSFANAIMDPRLPFRRPTDLFFRYRNRDFISNNLVLTASRSMGIVAHGSRECTCGIPGVAGMNNESTFSPWKTRIAQHMGMLITDIDDETVIVGGEGRLAHSLEAAAERRPGQPLVVAQMCDYECLVEDIEGVATQAGSDHGTSVTTFSTTFGERHPLWRADCRWEPLLGPLRDPSTRPTDEEIDPQGVNLVGMGPGETTNELVDLLRELGINVLGEFFPYFDPDTVAPLRRARLWVLNPWRVVQLGPGEILSDAGLDVLSAEVPHGVEGTLRWLDRVGEGLGREPPSQATRAALAARHAPEIEALRASARGKSVAFVVPERHLAELADPAFFYGLNPVAFLTELGFGVTLVTTGGEGDARGSEVSSLDEGLGVDADADVRIVAHDPARSVVDTLRALDCELVYSEYTADERVAQAGKVQFDVRDFEPGFRGAVRTARRLLSAASAPFFRRYQQYLGDTGGGAA